MEETKQFPVETISAQNKSTTISTHYRRKIVLSLLETVDAQRIVRTAEALVVFFFLEIMINSILKKKTVAKSYTTITGSVGTEQS